MAKQFCIGRAAAENAIGRQVAAIQRAREAHFARQREESRVKKGKAGEVTGLATIDATAILPISQPVEKTVTIQDGKWTVDVVVGGVVATTNPAKEYVENNKPRRFVVVGTGCHTGHRCRG